MPRPQSLVYPLAPFDHNLPHVFRAQHLLFRGEDFDADLLRASLDKLITATPFLTGTVLPAATPGWLQVAAPFANVHEVFSVADKRAALDYEQSRARGFPPSDFPAEAGFDPAPLVSPAPAPVFRVRASVITGGVVFSVFLHHAAFDGPGCAVVLRAWAEICRTGKAVPLDIDRAPFSLNQKRGAGRIEDHPAFCARPVDMIPPPPPPAAGTMWYFSPSKLAALKEAAGAGLDEGEWVSTHDAICALLWTRVCAARRGLGADVTALMNTVDARKRMRPRVSEDFTGNSTTMVAAFSTLSDLDDLSAAARLVRASINEGTTDARVRDTLSLFSNFADDLRALSPKWDMFLNSGFVVTSWARLDTYELDWGKVFGEGKRCDRMRHPWNFMPSVAAPMPAGAHGPDDTGLEVLVMLSPEQMDVFERDEVLLKYAERVY